MDLGMMKKLFFLLASALFAGAQPARAQDSADDAPINPPPNAPAFHETKEEHDARTQWFRDAHFGMFIHWGLYSQPAGVWKDRTTDPLGGHGAEWIQANLNIPTS